MLTCNKHIVTPHGTLRAALTARYVFPSKVELAKREYAKAAEILPPEAEHYAYDGGIPAPKRHISLGNATGNPAKRQQPSIIYNAVSLVGDHSQDQPTSIAEVDEGQLASVPEDHSQAAHQEKTAHLQQTSAFTPAVPSVDPLLEYRSIVKAKLQTGEVKAIHVAKEAQEYFFLEMKDDLANGRITPTELFGEYKNILSYAERLRGLAEQAAAGEELAKESTRVRKESREEREHN